MMLLLAGMFAVGCDRKQSPAPVKAQAKFHSSEGRFSADFPGEPTHKFQLSPRGGHPVHAYTTKVSGQLAFTITYEDFPPADVQNPEFALQQSVRENGAYLIPKTFLDKEVRR